MNSKPIPGSGVIVDPATVAAALAGDQAAREAVVSAFEKYIRAVVKGVFRKYPVDRRSRREDLSEDMLQDGRLGVLLALAECKSAGAFVPYARLRVLGTVYDKLRRGKRAERPLDEAKRLIERTVLPKRMNRRLEGNRLHDAQDALMSCDWRKIVPKEIDADDDDRLPAGKKVSGDGRPRSDDPPESPRNRHKRRTGKSATTFPACAASKPG